MIEGIPAADHIEPTTTPATITLGNIALPNITGHTIHAAYAGFRWTQAGSSSGSLNYLTDGTLEIDKAAAGWIAAITNLEYAVIYGISAAGARSGSGTGGEIFGNTDISARVAFNATHNFRITLATAVGDNLYIWGARPVLVVVVS